MGAGSASPAALSLPEEIGVPSFSSSTYIYGFLVGLTLFLTDFEVENMPVNARIIVFCSKFERGSSTNPSAFSGRLTVLWCDYSRGNA